MAEQCRYMAAAYPTLDAEDTCGFGGHRHDEATFALARAFAVACQQPDPTDEQIGWFLEDAAEVVDDFKPAPKTWIVTEPELIDEPGLEFSLLVNGVEYVVQENDSGGHVVCHPVSRTTWEQWRAEAEAGGSHG